jgi:hypothetical protein
MLSEAERSALDDEPVCLFTRQGELIWRSQAWTRPGPRRDDQLLGRRWWEFLFREDLGPLLAWLATDEMRPVSFRALLPRDGEIATVTYRKIECRGNWLCVGAVVVHGMLPAAPTMEQPEQAGEEQN